MSSLSTKFYGSQVGGKSTTPHSYTGSPLSLLKHDILSALQFYLYLPYIVFPLTPQLSGPLCELYPSRGNLYDIFLHGILILIQLPFVLSVPFWLMFPLWWVVGCVVGFVMVNQSICFLLNGKDMRVESKKEFAERRKEHEHEQWIFLNGVAVGRNWLQSNVDRLALTFGRPILGVHNKTNGIIFDVLQCLIQRNFTYATQDVRDCYAIVKSTLYQPHLTKVIFILHSQGGIEGGLIIDWLLQEVPQDLLAKLEVYTFGNAANHFNNPHLHLLSQHAALRHPTVPATTKTTTSVHYHDPIQPLHDPHATPLPHAQGVSSGASKSNGISNGTSLNTTPPKPITRQISRQESTSGKTIRYIEHYAHTSDFVACWGVLHFTKNVALGPSAPRFMGRVFERGEKGHQMNMHYLDGMFPLRTVEDSTSSTSSTDAAPAKKSIMSRLGSRLGLGSVSSNLSDEQDQQPTKGGIGNSGFLGVDEREGKNAFMESILELGLSSSSTSKPTPNTSISTPNIISTSITNTEEDASELASEREGLAMSYLGAHGEPLEDGEREVLVRDMSPIAISPGTMKRARLGMTSLERLGGKEVNGDGDGDEKKRGEGVDVGGERMRFRVKDLSRLWMYVNGKSPKMDETDVGIARMATI
ncbi:hypothetical protein BKA65DRAFT_531885 [Rhexocercosporidium sp. MPI-PUGE-AT-0058]|nr:hypothetical protein BKA65DRAFT_531885 [Rhexocercosporidium sp. MPI-PUGE-AT-0058]